MFRCERRQGKGTFVTKPIDEPSTQLAKIALISGLELEYFQSSTYFLNILTKVRHILAERQLGSRLYLGLSDYSPDQAMPNSTVDFFDDLAGKMVTGVVATGFSAQKAILEELSARNIPIISTDEGFPQAVSTDSDNLIKEGKY